ncbi:gamma-glutamylcyclotransferase [Azohydromonas aeria]|uniref:gamma-glutamylcyclotransferase n=1 Tax=Azohydromonas aeria TaxID=2590212 RepID=UPI0012F722DB|nr:gamma-glutamylcyclotransferase [Azohydromonas aeria]
MTTFNDDLLDDGGQSGGALVPETEYPPNGERLPWSDAQRERSLAATLALRPPGPLRVFAYGSLMWQPSIEFEAEELATLDGWHRSYCLRADEGRGSPDCPGRELSLQPGGQAQAVTLRLKEKGLRAELRKLWEREMANGGYRPLWTPVRLAGGGTVMALSFVAKPGHPLHETDVSVDTVARLAAVARGDAGTNADYVRDAARALAERGLTDEYVAAVARAVDGAG